jgi:hypothetical protein
MKLLFASSLIAAAAAFSPSAQKGKVSTALSASPYENELGVVAPTGFFGTSFLALPVVAPKN